MLFRSRAGHDAAAEDAVKFVVVGVDAGGFGGGYFGYWQRFGDGGASRCAHTAAYARRGLHDFFVVGVPLTTRRTFAEPFGARRAALLTDVCCSCFFHFTIFYSNVAV